MILAGEFGGSWKEWLKIFLSLLNTNYTTRNNSEYQSSRVQEEAHSIVRAVMGELTQYNESDVLLKEIFSWQRHPDNQYWQWILECFRSYFS